FISRFQSPGEQKKILNDLANGLIDIIIGTHRLLQKDVRFKNVKLIIIDEEQRFGVKQKEKLKKQFAGIDILTLSATPIPRTMYMSLSGIRDLSLIETPPEGRQPIQTYVGPYQEPLVINAIQAEINRNGQVFYVHNRVETIYSRLKHLSRLMPGVRFGYVHGQMRPHELEKTMMDFLHKKIDCLVATSIIESGLDIPNVNTLIVENAQDMGLAQLYQLRGRVGRERQRAHCFLLYEPDLVMTGEAQKRLEALREFTALGSGFHLAMRDLEIRGAGNILGAKQHGFMQDIGFDLYCRLLKKEVDRLGAQPQEIPAEQSMTGPRIDCTISAFFPASYIPAETERIRLYRKAFDARNTSMLDNFKQELIDRFGPLPAEAEAFMRLVELRMIAREANVASIEEKKGTFWITMTPGHRLNPDWVVETAQRYGSLVQFQERDEGFSILMSTAALGQEGTVVWLKKFLSSMI
ncbi:MAG: transcription-repair coupling factor, partial [Elusimicrobia bacterium]|nr:transcription-repair coupling factor [Elusimicrobiota bacterium]MBD3411772.1 transcription-repair coupling factor [Elusimicrobiota bacterium]